MGGTTKWSERGRRKDGRPAYFLVTGRAYPKVIKGANPTRRLQSDPGGAREAFYNDPAAKLSEADLDEFNGTEGMPLCVEHDVKDAVGDVRLGWLNEGDLKIMARIPLEGERNLRLVEEIKAGKWKGFSVGYVAQMSSVQDPGGGPPRGTQIDSKHFREVSLVEEPFFQDCHLAYGCVAASAGKEATKIASYNPADRVVRSYYPIQMSATIPSTTTTQQPTEQPAANLLPNAGNPAAQGAVRTGELMSQTEQLKTHLEEQASAKRALEERLAAFERSEQERNAKKEAKRRAAEAEAAARAEQERLQRLQEEAEYRVTQMPKFNAFVEALTASGAPLPEDLKAGYLKIFTDVSASSRTAAAQLEAQTKSMQQQQARMVELQASARQAEEAKARAEAEARAMQEVLSRSSHVLNHSRQHFAAALAAPQAPSATPSAGEDASKRQTEAQLNASARDEYGGLMYIMMPTPSPAERAELDKYGYKSEAAVRASHKDDPYSIDRPFTTRLPVPATHRNLHDKERNLNLPASARYVNPGWFAFLCSQTPQLMGDLSDVVRINAGKNEIERKDAEEWEARQFYKQQTVPQHAAGGPQ